MIATRVDAHVGVSSTSRPRRRIEKCPGIDDYVIVRIAQHRRLSPRLANRTSAARRRSGFFRPGPAGRDDRRLRRTYRIGERGAVLEHVLPAGRRLYFEPLRKPRHAEVAVHENNAASSFSEARRQAPTRGVARVRASSPTRRPASGRRGVRH